MKETQLSHHLVYSCFFMNLYEDQVRLDNNVKSSRIYIEHPGAAAVLPLTEDKKVVLVKQYRYPIHSETLEIPAGKKDNLEEPGYDCVVRELEEETGMRAKKIKKVLDIHSCLGYSNELIELFIAYDVYKVDNPLKMDDDEHIEIGYYDKNEIKVLLDNNKITDAKTIIMLQRFLTL
jgi:ADP-ribose pyrophosphatase